MANLFGLGAGTLTRDQDIDTLIGRNTKIVGDVHFSGGLHIDGAVKGNVIADDGSNASLTLSEHGRIDGEVRVPNLNLNGQVRGDVHSSEFIELNESARISGDLHYAVIKMNVGAEVNGKMIHQAKGKKAAETTPFTSQKNKPGQAIGKTDDTASNDTVAANKQTA